MVLSRSVGVATFVATGLSACARLGYDLLPTGSVEWDPPILTSGLPPDADPTPRRRTHDDASQRATVDAGPTRDTIDAETPPLTSVDSGGGIDGGLPPLDSLGPFGAPRLIAELVSTGSTTDDPSVTDDRLLLFFDSSRPGGPGSGDIWHSTRSSPTDTWTPPVLSAISTGFRETTPGISRNGLSLWFGSNRPGPGACATGGGVDIWVATRATRDDNFGTPTCVDELSGPSDDLGPSLSADGLTILLTVNDGSFPKLHIATRGRVEEPFGAPTRIDELDGPQGDGDGCLTREGRQVFFATDRDDPNSTSLAVAARTSDSVPFGPLSYLTEVNGPGSDSDPWVSSDGRYIVWTSNRSGSQQLYEASR